ncbi:MAG: tetratricopeptide repeat protein, partial [Anaerolineae bacterium]
EELRDDMPSGCAEGAADAVEAARTAVLLAPEEPLAHEYLGWGLYLSGELAAAEEALERAIALDSASARAHFRLGIIRIAMGNSEEARQDFARAVDLDPEGTYRQRAELALGGLDGSR